MRRFFYEKLGFINPKASGKIDRGLQYVQKICKYIFLCEKFKIWSQFLIVNPSHEYGTQPVAPYISRFCMQSWYGLETIFIRGNLSGQF